VRECWNHLHIKYTKEKRYKNINTASDCDFNEENVMGVLDMAVRTKERKKASWAGTV
jgi:hypothetical protein